MRGIFLFLPLVMTAMLKLTLGQETVDDPQLLGSTMVRLPQNQFPPSQLH